MHHSSTHRGSGQTGSFEPVRPVAAFPVPTRGQARSRAIAVLAAAILAAFLLSLTATGAAARSFPVTVNAANGKVTVKKRPKRIVVLSATATETVYAIGAGDQVIAVDDQSNYPARAPQTKLSSYRPNAEAVAGYRPDLVVTSTSANKLLPALKRLKIPALLVPAATNIGAAYEQMGQIGSVTGHRPAANRLVGRMKRRIAAAVRRAPSGRRLSFFHELGPDLYSATSGTFIGRVYALFGLRNIADRAGKAGNRYPQLSAEYVIAADPDIVVLADTKCCKQTVRKVRQRPGWRSISAVKKGNVFALNDDIPSRWGPRIVNFVELVARALTAARD